MMLHAGIEQGLIPIVPLLEYDSDNFAGEKAESFARANPAFLKKRQTSLCHCVCLGNKEKAFEEEKSTVVWRILKMVTILYVNIICACLKNHKTRNWLYQVGCRRTVTFENYSLCTCYLILWRVMCRTHK